MGDNFMEYKCECGHIAKSETFLRLHKLSCEKKTKDKVKVPVKRAEMPVKDTKSDEVSVTLKNIININGKEYGGTVLVDKSLAKELIYRDDLKRQSELRVRKNIVNTQNYLGDIKG